MAGDAIDTVNAADYLGRTLDGCYRLDAVLGQRGMGRVFAGMQTSITVRWPIASKEPQTIRPFWVFGSAAVFVAPAAGGAYFALRDGGVPEAAPAAVAVGRNKGYCANAQEEEGRWDPGLRPDTTHCVISHFESNSVVVSSR